MLSSFYVTVVLSLTAQVVLSAPSGTRVQTRAEAVSTPAPSPPPYSIMPVEAIAAFAPAVKAKVKATSLNNSSQPAVVARDMIDSFQNKLSERDSDIHQRAEDILIAGVVKRQPKKQAITAAAAKNAIAASPCVGSNANDTYITSLFYYGGIGTTVELCPGAIIPLTNAIFFFFPNQTLQTQGLPIGITRATLRVTDPGQSCAIFGAWDGADGVALRNVQVDGARPALGILYGGLGLIEMGGNTKGQVVSRVHAFEPRGWTVLHGGEGYENSCSGMKITSNDIGPSGHAPSGAQQFKKRDSTGSYTPGQWADGISLACQASTVSGNVVTDATDGGIVIFGAPGSTISGNTIQSIDRQLLGGINMVDFMPYLGSFEGTQVLNNVITAQSNFIKLGIAIGGMTWGVDNRTASRTFGGVVQSNTFSSGPTGYFGYAIGIAGHQKVTVSGNSARAANFGGIESSSCFTSWFPLPRPQAFIADPYTTPGCKLQRGFNELVALVLLICKGPGAIAQRGSPI